MRRCRLRDLSISLGRLPPGPENAITDVAGFEVGYSTVMADQPSILRTGVTAIWPAGDVWQRPMFARFHSFNGNGELTGAHWLAEQGLLTAPIAIPSSESGLRKPRVQNCDYPCRLQACAPIAAPRAGPLRRLARSPEAERLEEIAETWQLFHAWCFIGWDHFAWIRRRPSFSGGPSQWRSGGERLPCCRHWLSAPVQSFRRRR
jgi:hypothetical protein